MSNGRHTRVTGIDTVYDNDPNYDARKSAMETFRRHPEKYSRDQKYHSSNGSNSKVSDLRTNQKVTVVVEHWSGCVGQGVSDDIRLAIEESFRDVKFLEVSGRVGSFEVFVNGTLLYSRITQGGYPYEEEVLEAVYRAKRGKQIYQIDRYSSSACAIL